MNTIRILCSALLFTVTSSIVTPILAASTGDFRRVAKQYAEGTERTDVPITLRYLRHFYVYVPLLVRGTINATFPGMLLTNAAKPVTKAATLKELFRYPGLITTFADDTAGFNDIAAKKVAALAQYCRLLEVQKIKLDALNRFGNVAGVLYEGTKLAFDAAGTVKSGVAGLVKLVKDLAKKGVQDAIVSFFTAEDARAVLASTQSAYDDARRAHKACKETIDAWNTAQTTTGRASPMAAKDATAKARDLFGFEAASMTALRQALERINNYPRLVTKINATDYAKGISGMNKLIATLEEQESFWSRQYDDANDENTRSRWAEEQLSRISVSTQCSSLNLEDGTEEFTYSTDSAPCTSFSNSVTSSALSFRCATSSGSWRNHWVKKIDVAGASTLRITADLGLKDHTRFFTECSGVGVKYDDYSSLLMLSEDPTTTLQDECNRIAPQAEWSQCQVSPTGINILATCGVSKCTASKACDMTVSTSGRDTVYLVYHASDAWLADIEGTMSNLSVCPTS